MWLSPPLVKDDMRKGRIEHIIIQATSEADHTTDADDCVDFSCRHWESNNSDVLFDCDHPYYGCKYIVPITTQME